MVNSSNLIEHASREAVTRYAPGAISGANRLVTSLRRRRSRLRTTALPTFLPIAYATCGTCASGREQYVTPTGPTQLLRPDLLSCSKVLLSRIRQVTSARSCSSGQALATPGPSSPDDRAPGATGHPMPETVGLRPLTRVGLERSLHCVSLVRTGPYACPAFDNPPTPSRGRGFKTAILRQNGSLPPAGSSPSTDRHWWRFHGR